MIGQTKLGTSIGPHRIARMLGGGQVGRVFACKPPESDQLVAIKMLRSKYAALGQLVMKARPQLERIDSHNVAKIYDVAVFNNVVYVVTELVEGESLQSLLHKGPLRIGEALTLARAVLMGLQEAWAHGVAHGDLRPANILLPPSAADPSRAQLGSAKLVDFLLAAPIEGTEALRGSPSYLAPELLVDTPPDALSDLYAVGCLLTEVLTGKPPFSGSAASVLEAQASTPAPSLARTLPGAPQALIDLVDRLLEKDRAKRLKTHADALTGIERALRGQALPAPRGPDLLPFVDGNAADGFDDGEERTDEFHTSPARELTGSGEKPAAPVPLPAYEVGVYRSAPPSSALEVRPNDDTQTNSRTSSVPSADDIGLILTPINSKE